VLASVGDGPKAAGRGSIFGPAAMEVLLQLGPRSGIAVDWALSLGPAKKDDGGSDWLVADVKRAAPSKALAGQLPPGMDSDIASLEGSQFRVQLTPDGLEGDLQLRLGKASKPELERVAQSAAEALALSTVPLPAKAVGAGAQWIAETRMPLSGLDVIAYRAFRVKSVEGDRLRLTLDVKAYAASTDVQIAGVPKGATLAQVEVACEGQLELVRGEALARKSDIQERVVMLFTAPGAPQPAAQPGQPPGNMLTAQVQSQTTLVRGEDLRAASRQRDLGP